MKGEIKKSDLRTGMVVETVDGTRYIVFLNTGSILGSGAKCKNDYLLSQKTYMCLGDYGENLKLISRASDDDFDVVKVFSFAPYSGIDTLFSLSLHSRPIFDKSKPIVMTIKEIEKVLGHKVAVSVGNIIYCDDKGE